MKRIYALRYRLDEQERLDALWRARMVAAGGSVVFVAQVIAFLMMMSH